MKTKRDLEKLVGKAITKVRTDILGNTEIAMGDDILTIKPSLGQIELELNGEPLSPFTCLELGEWNAIAEAFPDITVNGHELHESSCMYSGMTMHAKWTEFTGLIIGINDVKSFDGKNLVLDDSGFCETE